VTIDLPSCVIMVLDLDIYPIYPTHIMGGKHVLLIKKKGSLIKFKSESRESHGIECA
jgi:hypothetical protein